MGDDAPPDDRHLTTRCLVVGIGNDLRRDDGVGGVVARACGDQVAGADVLVVRQVLPELAPALAGRRTVVFVDASVATPAPGGEVVTRRLTPDRRRTSSGHLGSPGQVLQLAATVGGRVPEAWLVTVAVTDLDVGEGLSPRTARLVPEAVDAVARILVGREHRSTATLGDR